MIRDLEELTLRVRDPEARAYIREAVRCYHAGAYRGAVVLGFAAGMDDLRRKIGELAGSGSASVDLKAGSKRIEDLFAKHQPFEAEAVRVAQQSAELLSVAEKQKLDAIQSVRNICAHPSGHPGSAEEARDVITTIIDLVLSRPGLFGVAAAKQLVARACQPVFFGAASGRDAEARVAQHALTRLESSAHAALIAEIIRVMDEREAAAVAAAAKSKGGPLTRFLDTLAKSRPVTPSAEERALALLYGASLAAAAGAHTAARAKLTKVLDASWAPRFAPIVLSCRVEVVGELEPDERARAIAHIAAAMGTVTDAELVVAAWVSNSALDGAELSYLLERVEQGLARRVDPRFLSLNWPAADRAFFCAAAKDAASTSYSAANAAIDAIQDLDAEQTGRATPEERWAYINALLKQSRTTPGATDSASALYRDGLGGRSTWLVEVFSGPMAPTVADSVFYADWDVLLRLGRASGVTVTATWISQALSALDVESRWRAAKVLKGDSDAAIAAVVRPWLTLPDDADRNSK